MQDVTNEQLLKVLRGIEARQGDIMRRLQKMEGNIVAASDRPKGLKISPNGQNPVFDTQN